MQMIEANYIQLTSLPLPSPALVIDTRGIEDDDVMDRLRIEIADLANEMKTQDIHHWRYLTEFISFWAREPMTYEDVNTLRPGYKNNTNHVQTGDTSQSDGTSTTATSQTGLTGKIDPSMLKGYVSPFFFQRDNEIAPLNEDRPADFLQQSISKIVHEVNRLRNNRHVAVADVEKTMSGRSVKDATVRVIFLTDAERPDSLATTAAYAAHLKEYFAKKERQNQQPLISTMAVCLNNTSETKPVSDLKELLWNDDWQHLDALILTEDYREDAAWIAGAIQTYIAELLLYVLMIVPPLRVVPVQAAPNSHKDTSSENAVEEKKEQSILLPPYTFLVGLAAMEHSARWGRRLLNFKIVEQTIEVIQKGVENERTRTKNIVTAWLNNWRAQVKNAVPDQVPGNIPALQAIPQASRAIKEVDRVFTSRTFSLSIGQSTLSDLQDYTDHLAETYTFHQGSQIAGSSLQEAVDSIPQIQQCLREWESKDPMLRKGTPLVNAQLDAQRVLSHPDFFTGASGAIPRAKMQLEELGLAITNFRSKHQQNPINLTERRKQLEESATNKIEVLQQHIESMPFLASALKFKQAMAWTTLILAIFLGVFATVVGIAWIHHVITYFDTHGPRLPLPAVTPVLDNILLLSSSPFAFVFWALVLVIILIFFTYVGRKLLIDQTRSATRVEAIFWLTLIVFFIFGLVISFSLIELASDSNSAGIISWLGFLPFVGAIAFIVALVIAGVETWYFIWWYRHLQEERARIASELNEEHEKNIQDVAGYIADTIALHLLQRTRLTNEKAGPGEYFQRINQLHVRLRDILENAQKQQRLARKRLTMSVSETQLGAGIGTQGDTWLNLRIRDELLDVNSLADGYNRLTERLDQEIGELKEFAVLLLRVLGEEPSAEIEQDFRDGPILQGSIEQHNAQVLMGTLVAMSLRISINATSIYSMTPLIHQYDSIANNLIHQPTAMKALIDGLRKKVMQNMLQPVIDRSTRLSETETHALATNALAAWGQMLWEGKDTELDRTLSEEGVLPKLLEMEDNAHVVKRLLGLRTSLFGRNFTPGQMGALYLLLPSSPQTHQFSQDLNLPRKHIITFPDVERMILLYVQHYAGEPLLLPAPANNNKANGADATATQGSTNGSTAPRPVQSTSTSNSNVAGSAQPPADANP